MLKVIVVVIAASLFGWYAHQQFDEAFGEPVPATPRACTAEAKICPDGSAVGRTGPNCEFAVCPGE